MGRAEAGPEWGEAGEQAADLVTAAGVERDAGGFEQRDEPPGQLRLDVGSGMSDRQRAARGQEVLERGHQEIDAVVRDPFEHSVQEDRDRPSEVKPFDIARAQQHVGLSDVEPQYGVGGRLDCCGGGVRYCHWVPVHGDVPVRRPLRLLTDEFGQGRALMVLLGQLDDAGLPEDIRRAAAEMRFRLGSRLTSPSPEPSPVGRAATAPPARKRPW
ncbi:hypothetical protein OG590_39700 (plasmid) [Streptomyces goshikiensis]|nr:hypothetical protein OG590_39700 [Streptomyces goshikiensis]